MGRGEGERDCHRCRAHLNFGHETVWAAMGARGDPGAYAAMAAAGRDENRVRNKSLDVGYWHGMIETTVNLSAPSARIYQTCTTQQGDARFLFKGIGMHEISSVQTLINQRFAGIAILTYAEVHEESARVGTVARDVTRVPCVDVRWDADVVLRKRAKLLRRVCNMPMLVLVLCFSALVLAAREINRHYAGYHDPFAHQIDAARSAWHTLVN